MVGAAAAASPFFSSLFFLDPKSAIYYLVVFLAAFFTVFFAVPLVVLGFASFFSAISTTGAPIFFPPMRVSRMAIAAAGFSKMRYEVPSTVRGFRSRTLAVLTLPRLRKLFMLATVGSAKAMSAAFRGFVARRSIPLILERAMRDFFAAAVLGISSAKE